MIILAFDSTMSRGSVAVCDGERVLAQFSVNNGMTHSTLLLPLAERAMESVGMKFSDVELFAVTEGPGSFTGVRIGIALVKGLAFGRDIPCVGVSALEAMAEGCRGLGGTVVPVMDARANRIYSSRFESEELRRVTDDRAMTLEQLCEELHGVQSPIYVVGDGYDKAVSVLKDAGIRTAETPLALRELNPVSVARIAYCKYLRGEYVSDKELSPTYLRVPKAESDRLEKLEIEKRKNDND